MINEISKLIEPRVDSNGHVTSWTFGVECECSETETVGYSEVTVKAENSKSLSDYTKIEIDSLYETQGLLAQATEQISAKNNKGIASGTFDYNSL